MYSTPAVGVLVAVDQAWIELIIDSRWTASDELPAACTLEYDRLSSVGLSNVAAMGSDMSNLAEGVVVPIPTLPAAVILILSAKAALAMELDVG